MVILGGLGSMAGVIVGGLVIQSFDRILAEELNAPIHWVGDQLNITWLQEHNLQSDRFLIFGLALVLMMLLRPGGLIPSNQRKREMKPADSDTPRQDQQEMYDVQTHDEPTAGGRA